MDLRDTIGYKIIQEWLAAKGHRPFPFQEETWEHIINGKSGLVNAPTGFGKTFSVFLGAVIDFIHYQIPGVISNVSNLADHAIVLGVLIILIESWRADSRDQKSQSADTPMTDAASPDSTPPDNQNPV